jgi:phage terminase large subunit
MIEVEIDKSVYLDCYHHLLEPNDIDIEIIWGGRDSGKSKFVAQLFTEESMALDYFRCLLIKETHESIKDAQWQMIKDNVEDWGLDHLFTFQTSPLGIKVANGNTYLTRGMDKPAKIRSVANPSHAWTEEANQISEAAFITLITGLRNDKGNVKLILTLNPEATCADYQDFWLFKMFFKKHYPHTLSFTDVIEMKLQVAGKEEIVRMKYRSTHVTYHDNPYVSPQRKAFHESLKETNEYWYNVFTLGLWGNQANDSPWAFAFSEKKHVGSCSLNRAQPVYLSWDFNRNPMACNVIQHYDNHVKVLEVVKQPKAGVDSMCEYIKVNYPGCLFIVTGDYSGESTSSLFQEQVTHYKLIKHHLSLSDGQIKVQPNPKLAKNSTHVNSILAYYKVTIDNEKAKPLIFDMKNVKRRADGTILKENRDDPSQQSDSLDGFRYFCNNFLGWFKPVV